MCEMFFVIFVWELFGSNWNWGGDGELIEVINFLLMLMLVSWFGGIVWWWFFVEEWVVVGCCCWRFLWFW